MGTENRRDWRALCKAVSLEKNSDRLRDLLAELLKTMEEPNHCGFSDTRASGAVRGVARVAS